MVKRAMFLLCSGGTTLDQTSMTVQVIFPCSLDLLWLFCRVVSLVGFVATAPRCGVTRRRNAVADDPFTRVLGSHFMW
jgi:hypothetical protein